MARPAFNDKQDEPVKDVVEKYVYAKYPDMTTKSKIRERLMER